MLSAWKLDATERANLLERFPPVWPDIIADHVTFASPDADAPAGDETGEIVGRIDDGQGLEALVVKINGTTRRPDGSTWHITWSLDRSRGRKPVQSNDVIARLGWKELPAPVPVSLRKQRA
jgi:hypothetical protein